jgi:hypothetical protein
MADSLDHLSGCTNRDENTYKCITYAGIVILKCRQYRHVVIAAISVGKYLDTLLESPLVRIVTILIIYYPLSHPTLYIPHYHNQR